MAIQPGTRLGPYEIVASIGAGGMGEVWRARDTRLEREVAIKVLPPGFADDEQLRQRFEREAMAISQLSHPHVCTLFDVGHETAEETGEPLHYLVMELLTGESLADRLQRGALPLEDVLRFGRQIASALDAAHRQGIIHRDLKPANVMLTKSGAKLLDFGLAKTAAGDQAPIDGLTNLPTEARPLTQQGTILGTFQYMAPEQLEGLEADARTDIFALGALLYEMATGQRAFQGSSKTSLIAAIVSHQPEPISNVTPMSPPALDHVVRRCLAKDPEERWQSAQDVASELEWIGEAGSQAGVAAPVAVRRKSRERLAWGLAAAALAAALVLLAAMLFRTASPPQETLELAIAPPAGGEFLVGDELGSGIISPDGTLVAFLASTEEGQGLWIRPLERDEPRLLPGTEAAYYPFWSPDSRWLAFFDRGGYLKKVEIRGGLPETICQIRQGRGGSWGEDGWIWLTPQPGGRIHRVPAEGGTAEPVTPELDAEHGETAHYFPQALPGGRSFLYFVRSSRKEHEGVYLGTVDDEGREVEKKRILTSSSSGLFVPREPGSLSGHLLWTREGQLVARTIDLGTGELTGDAVELGIPARVLVSHRGSLVSVSDNGILVSASTEPLLNQVVWTDRSGTVTSPLEAPEGGLYWPKTSPDGRSLIIMVGRGGDGDLWLMDLASGAYHPVTSGPTYDELGAWSGDSSSVIYLSNSQVNFVSRLDLDRGGTTSTLLDIGKSNFYPGNWTSDDVIFGTYSHEGTIRIGALDLADPSSIHVVAEDEETSSLALVDASPDGRWLAWIGSGSGSEGAFVSAIVKGDQGPSLAPDRQRIAVDSPSWINWSRQGDELFVLSQGRTVYSIPVATEGEKLQVGTPQALFRTPSPPLLHSISASPDGQRFYFVIEPNASRRTLRVVLNWQSRLGAG